ncbi:MAG: hypothetical protein CM15mP120_27930 [Pseudomonadota bacterium]|nr:MAG: hypothetical protein CM15mP120_27930 [Pseudomonadota bacterium]
MGEGPHHVAFAFATPRCPGVWAGSAFATGGWSDFLFFTLRGFARVWPFMPVCMRKGLAEESIFWVHAPHSGHPTLWVPVVDGPHLPGMARRPEKNWQRLPRFFTPPGRWGVVHLLWLRKTAP